MRSDPKGSLLVVAGIVFFITVVAVGLTVKASNYEECRKVFSQQYCLTQMVTK